MVCLTTHRSSSCHSVPGPFSLVTLAWLFLKYANSFLPLGLQKKETKATIPLHYDVTPSFTLFRFLFKTISLDILSKSWSGQPIPSPAHLPNPGIKPGSPALQVDSFPPELLCSEKLEIQENQQNSVISIPIMLENMLFINKQENVSHP